MIRRSTSFAAATLVAQLWAMSACSLPSDEENGLSDESIGLVAAPAALDATEWGRYQGHLYALYVESSSWESARAHCEWHGGHLVSLSSTSESDFVRSLFAGRNIPRVWIGLTDEVSEGAFRWLTGESLCYANWDYGEPNNIDNAEHYAAMYPSGTWVDLPATWTAAHVCEFGDPSYRLVERSRSWSEAAQDCEDRGGYLATVSSPVENGILQQLLSARNIRHAWLGLTDEVSEGSYRWETWEPITFSNWGSGEPNNAGGNEDYIEMRRSGTWNDLPLSWSVASLCEFGRANRSAVAVLDLRGPDGDDLAVVETCRPQSSYGSSCEQCPASTIGWTLSVEEQATSATANYLIIEKGQGVHEPESRLFYNFVQLELVDVAGVVSEVTIEFGTGLTPATINYRPNGDVIVSLAALLSGGKRVRRVDYTEGYSLGVLCNAGPAFTLTRYYSRMLFAE